MKRIVLTIALLGMPIFSHAAFHEFYMISGSSNTNSGSTTDAQAPIYTSSGSFGASGTLNRYISTWTAFGSATVGQMASIYITTNASAAGTLFISSIVAVVDSSTIDVDTTTIKYGVIPAASVTNMYSCKIGGAWRDLGIVSTIFNARTMPQSTRINIKAGTYANAGNTITIGASGGNGNLLWWRGYKNNPGDEDTNNLGVAGTDIPSITFTTGQLSVTGANQIFSNLSVTGSIGAATGVLDNHASNQTFYRCQIIGSSNVANGMAFVQNSAGNNVLVESCYIKASTFATNAIQCASGGGCFIVGNVLVGGQNTVQLNGPGSLLYGNIIYGSSGSAVNVSGTGPEIVIGNSIYQPTTDGLHILGQASGGPLIFNNYFENVNQANTAAINLIVATNTVHISGNAYYGCTLNVSTTVLEGFTIYDNASLAKSAFQNPTIQNFSINSNAEGIGFPGLFENLPNQLQGYMDVGAVIKKRQPGGGFSVAN